MKHHTRSFSALQAGRQTQRGISLIMVLLVLVLVALTALSASRSSFFNETVTGNEADFNRAMSAAEAMVRDAQLDIMGVGVAPCGDSANNYEGCRLSASGIPSLAEPFFPGDGIEADALRTALNNTCVQGICAPGNWPANALPDRFWDTNLTAFTPTAATYGQFTRANPALTGNPILTAAAPARAWYWTELIQMDTTRCAGTTGTSCTFGPTVKTPFSYRITAVARGSRANTLAVIQTYFVPNPMSP
ncbi:MAG: hypothetical protein RLZZ401_467 [Pseudomonadota bacterium]|jgi:type IV pilus assembly protein PilX